MDIDDLEPVRKETPKKDLSPLSVAELENYIGELNAEIHRARQAIAAKQAVRNGAEGLFRK